MTSKKRGRRRPFHDMLLPCAVLLSTMTRVAAADDGPYWFGQAGKGDKNVESATFGLVRSFRAEAARDGSRWDFLGEISVGRWKLKPNDPDAKHHATQLGATPVLRYLFGSRPDAWFVELGVGANVITPIFHSEDRRFSTTFNFGDHAGIGKRFGASGENEIAFRIQHYSNAGIKHPNPGEDFVQLRIAHRF